MRGGDDCLGWLLDEGSIKDYCPFQSVREIVIKMSFYISIYTRYIFFEGKNLLFLLLPPSALMPASKCNLVLYYSVIKVLACRTR